MSIIGPIGAIAFVIWWIWDGYKNSCNDEEENKKARQKFLEDENYRYEKSLEVESLLESLRERNERSLMIEEERKRQWFLGNNQSHLCSDDEIYALITEMNSV